MQSQNQFNNSLMQNYDHSSSTFHRNQRSSIPPPQNDPLIQKPVQYMRNNLFSPSGDTRLHQAKDRVSRNKMTKLGPVKTMRGAGSRKFISALPKIQNKQVSPMYRKASKKKLQRLNRDIRISGIESRDENCHENIITKDNLNTLNNFNHYNNYP